MARKEHYNAITERENNSVGRSIARARKEKGLSLAALSELLLEYGVKTGPPTISKWENGGYIPTAYQYYAVRSALGIEDALSGEQPPELDEAGMKKLREYRADLIATGRYRPQPPAREPIRYVDMPVSLLAVSAGTGAFLDAENFEMVSFPEASIPAGAEFGVRVSGDSMEPVYRDGQIVWVKPCETLRLGEVGIFLYDGDGYMKVYTEQDGEWDGVAVRQPVLVSYNRKYEPIQVRPDSDFRIAGRVMS